MEMWNLASAPSNAEHGHVVQKQRLYHQKKR